MALLLVACKKKPIADVPDEHGRLNLISANLEKAFGTRALPPVDESPSFAARLRAWVDFRDCAIRTYVARRRASDAAREHGADRPTYHASVGDETVEECAVQAAVEKDDASFCERLAIDFKRQDGLPPMPAMRCWDTRARVLGHPAECPLQWLTTGVVGRNAECLAMAARDASFCVFAPSEARCRALVTGDADQCHGAPLDCRAAVAYWEGLVPARQGQAAFAAPALTLAAPNAPNKPGDVPGLKFHLAFLADQNRADRVQVQAPLDALGIDWPAQTNANTMRPAGLPPGSALWGVDINQLFSPEVTPKMAEVAFVSERVSMRFAFTPAGLPSGSLPLGPPGPAAAATLFVALKDSRGKRLICQPGFETKGTVTFKTEGQSAGGFVTGHIDAQAFPCDDGTTAHLQGDFRLAILSTR